MTNTTSTFTVGDRVVFVASPDLSQIFVDIHAGVWKVAKVNPKSLNLVHTKTGEKVRSASMYLTHASTRGAAKKATAVKAPVKKARAKTKPEPMTTAYGAKVGDVVTLTDSGAKRWTIVKVTARTLWVDAVKGDDAYTISHDLVSKIVKSA